MELREGHFAIRCPDGVAAWGIDPYSDEILVNPEPYYAELRARGPLVYLERYAMLACGRYAETKEVFSDWTRFVSSRGVGQTDFSLEKPWRAPSIVLEVDPPYHSKTKGVMLHALSPRAVAGLREAFQSAADRLVDTLLEKGAFDAVPDVAEAYPTTVFPRAVGMTAIDPRKLIDYAAMVFNALGPDNERRRQSLAKGPEVVPAIVEQCKRERLNPEGLGAAIYDAAERGEITAEEAGMLVRSLLSAGVDTTVSGIGNTIWCLARNPAAFAQLKAEPRLARAAFEEALRLTSPVHSFCRTAPRATDVSGAAIPQDAKILCVLGAANLDPDFWPNADHFDITRAAGAHLAFGVGIHGCVGQNIARAEAEALLSAIARKVAAIELAGEPVWRANNAIHALESLPLRFKAK